MDVNEKIIEEWLRLCKRQFTIANIPFKVPHNYSNIDILAVDKNGKFYDYEVKWRSKPWSAKTLKKTVGLLVGQMKRRGRKAAIERYIGNKPYNKVFIMTRIG